MDINVGDTIVVKKNHPCDKNAKTFAVLRIGIDFKIRCVNCGHEIMVSRSKIEKSIKSINRKQDN